LKVFSHEAKAFLPEAKVFLPEANPPLFKSAPTSSIDFRLFARVTDLLTKPKRIGFVEFYSNRQWNMYDTEPLHVATTRGVISLSNPKRIGFVEFYSNRQWNLYDTEPLYVATTRGVISPSKTLAATHPGQHATIVGLSTRARRHVRALGD
jgi:hypothetical protein